MARTIQTNKQSYETYVKNGSWKPKGKPIFHRYFAAKVEVEARTTKGTFIPATVIIVNYFQ